MTEHSLYVVSISIMFAFTLILFTTAIMSPIPYGRYVRPKMGPEISKLFTWILMEGISAFVVLFFFIKDQPQTLVPYFFLLLWEIHYLYRTFFYPFKMKNTVPVIPLVMAAVGILFNIANSTANAISLTLIHHYDMSWFADPRFIIGVILFIAGFAINVHSDNTLMNLRKPGEMNYKIPHGGLFRWISCPNYFGEIVEWLGWGIATWSLAGFIFAMVSFANLVPRAIAHHRWYKQNFPDYPKERWAIFYRIL